VRQPSRGAFRYTSCADFLYFSQRNEDAHDARESGGAEAAPLHSDSGGAEAAPLHSDSGGAEAAPLHSKSGGAEAAPLHSDSLRSSILRTRGRQDGKSGKGRARCAKRDGQVEMGKEKGAGRDVQGEMGETQAATRPTRRPPGGRTGVESQDIFPHPPRAFFAVRSALPMGCFLRFLSFSSSVSLEVPLEGGVQREMCKGEMDEERWARSSPRRVPQGVRRPVCSVLQTAGAQCAPTPKHAARPGSRASTQSRTLHVLVRATYQHAGVGLSAEAGQELSGPERHDGGGPRVGGEVHAGPASRAFLSDAMVHLALEAPCASADSSSRCMWDSHALPRDRTMSIIQCRRRRGWGQHG
jgi:hypothetical protein